MIAIGSFQFPDHLTTTHLTIIEAKSKVRKEIRIQSLLRLNNPRLLEDTLNQFRGELESFDRQETELYLHQGRFYKGRQRHVQIVPSPDQSLAFIDLLVLTNDRYEWGSILHTHQQKLFNGQALFSLFNLGNWVTSPLITITPTETIESVQLKTLQEDFSLNQSIENGQTLIIDSETYSTKLDGNTIHSAINENYPVLLPGSNHITIRTQPTSAEVHCTIQYRDKWV